MNKKILFVGMAAILGASIEMIAKGRGMSAASRATDGGSGGHNVLQGVRDTGRFF